MLDTGLPLVRYTTGCQTNAPCHMTYKDSFSLIQGGQNIVEPISVYGAHYHLLRKIIQAFMKGGQ